MTEDEKRERDRTARLAQLGSLLAGFAHEIKNPLSTIGLNLQLVKEDFAGAESARDRRTFKRLSAVETEVKRLQSILEQFLGFVRTPAPNRRKVDPAAMLQTLVDLSMPEMRERGIAMKLFLGPNLGRAWLDPDQVRAAIVNLLRNAEEACGPGCEVLISVRRDGDDLLIQVTDTGSGMTSDVLAKVFTPYFSTKKGGTGLGLAMVKKIVEEHGGTLEVSSEPGRGTQFRLRLPVGPSAADADGESA